MSTKNINILIACEESQAICKAFRERGFNSYSCDIQPCRKRDGHPEWHIQDDVSPYLAGKTEFSTMDGKRHKLAKWNLIIAHPPCTYISKAGSIHMFPKGKLNQERYRLMLDAVKFFYKCYNAKADFVAVENPIPLKIAQLPRPSFYIQPYWFGERYSKKTYWWCRNLPPIMPTIINPNHPSIMQKRSSSKARSKTPILVAKEYARQWGDYILEDYNHAHK